MKYIRTKDSIDLLIKSIDSYIVKDSESSFEKAIDEETLLKNYKVADNIIDLCDKFVVEKIDEEHKKENLVFSYWLTARINAVKGEDLYGAIWTDKGLIYVAKMNEKGALELL